MQANEKQVGGDHYKTSFQHWDLVSRLKLPYMPAQITRYIARWRKKNGVEDLQKAIHYMQKFMEEESLKRASYRAEMERFLFENVIQEHERIVFNMLINYNLGDEDRLLEAYSAMQDLLGIITGQNPADPTFIDNGDEWKR